MIEISLLTGNHEPLGEGIVFELVSSGGEVVASGATDNAGVVSFDVESTGMGAVAIRWAADQDTNG